MKNDITYEYRVFTNRLIDVESMEVGICTSKVINELKSKDKVDGRFFHTSDTDEWFFCWNGKLQKLNLKGDSDVSAALEEVEKLIADAKVAVEDAKKTAGEAKDAAAAAKDAADSATSAVETIENKADKSEVAVLTAKVDSKADSSDVDELSKKVDAIKIPSLDGYATEAFVSDKVSEIKVPTKVSDLENDKNYLTSDVADKKYAPIGSEGVDLGDYATKEFVEEEISKINVPTNVSAFTNDAGYLTKQDISGKQDNINDLDDIRIGANLGKTALQSVPEEYITETELNDKGYLTVGDANSKYATQDFVKGEIEKINIPTVPTNVSEFINDAGYLTDQDLSEYAKQEWVEQQGYLTEHQDISGKQDVIENLNDIISGASAGATALQPGALDGYVTSENVYTKAEIDALIGVAKSYIKDTILA